MQYFVSDYMEGAHPKILERLIETNMEKTPGYGTDIYSESAREKIKIACGCPKAQVYFLAGGTQTNKAVISAILRPYEGVISAKSGHINVHEAGAIENSGHKVLTLKSTQAKLYAEDINKYMELFYKDTNYEHTVKPGMVYISHPSEYGTIYSKKELKEIHKVCKKYNMPFFIDGARLGYGLAAENTDVTIKDIAKNCDVFYIGGTKVGALFGEAVVITKPDMISGFTSIIKQQGALLAKGRLIGIQFDTLFTDDLYIKISKPAIVAAMKIKKALIEKDYDLYIDSPTNQQFAIVSNKKMEELSKDVEFGFMESYDDSHSIIRFCTSWATLDSDVDKLIKLL